MSRIKVHLPDSFKFSTSIKIRVSDLNYGNHVGNDTILSLSHEARLQYLTYLGFDNEVHIENNIGIVVADAAVVYKSEAFYGDELAIKIGIDDINKYGFDMFYEITNAQSGNEVARVKTGIICLDYDTRKIALMPDVLKNAVT
ncbi:thioesterase [Fulvivirga sp. RKSG066]|uniref:thioesterase family protein n=1 Tax=Fulvivirga aurantia TaxID=2529383 RepID=UPI0012BBAEBE|nr:thioesterase family protein [Fulvivirga aurantia]MTI20267.1 thioesterase [Fulvivirga aurantia]